MVWSRTDEETDAKTVKIHALFFGKGLRLQATILEEKV